MILNYLKNFCREYGFPLIIFWVSRIIIFVTLVFVAAYNIGIKPTINQWDAPHYISIAQHGYQITNDYTNDGSLIAFFPLYPSTIWLVHFITTLNFETAGVVSSLIFGTLSIIILYKLVSDWKGNDAGITAVFLLSFYPSSVFLSSSYTESLFLFLTFLTFYLFRKQSNFGATLSVALAIITRITGSILGLLFAWYIWKQTKNIFILIAYSILVCIPFFIFLYFQYIYFGTPFAFLIAQKIRWLHQADFPWNGLWNFISYVLYDTRFGYPIMWRTDAVYLFISILTLILSYKKISWDVWFFGLGVVVLTLSSTFILGMDRYMLLVVPFYFYWAYVLSKRPYIFQLVLSVSAGWMIFNTVLFVLSKNLY